MLILYLYITEYIAVNILLHQVFKELSEIFILLLMCKVYHVS